MTVSTTQTRFANLGDSSTTDFSFNCKFFVDANIVVKVVTTATGAILATPSYTIVNKVSDGNGGYSSATVRFATAPATGTTVIRYLDIGLTQEVNFTSEGNVLTAANRFADRDELKLQRADDRLDRALVLNDGEIFAIDPTMPNVTGATAGQFLALGSGKTTLIWATGAAGGTISAAMLPVATAASLAAGQIAFGVREVLTANRTYYWAAAADGGSDSNSGLTTAAPFATFAKARAVAQALDVNKYTLTIKRHGTTTITERLDIDCGLVGQIDDADFIIEGDTTTPSNCTISTTLSAVPIHGSARCSFTGFKVASSAGQGIQVYEDARVRLGAIEFGTCGAAHLQVAGGWAIRTTNWTTSGDAPQHAVVEVATGHLDLAPSAYTDTASGTRTFSDVIFDIAENSTLSMHSASWVGTWVGQRYRRANNGTIIPRTKQESLPGTIEGTNDDYDFDTGQLYGLTLANNVSDATNDIDVAIGGCLDCTGQALIEVAAMTKQLDAAWAVGSAAGGLDGGSIANATYHVHAISKAADATGDVIFSLSHDKAAVVTMTIASPGVVTMTGHGLIANSPIKFSTTGALPTGVTAGTQYYVIAGGLTADAFTFSTSIGGSAVNTTGTQSGVHTCLPGPAMPSGYRHFRRIGSIIRSAGAILAFTQDGDEFLLKVPVDALSGGTNNPGTSAVTPTLTVPVGIKVRAKVGVRLYDATPAADSFVLLTSPDQTDTAPSATLFSLAIILNATPIAINTGVVDFIRTNVAAQIRYRLGAASTTDHTIYINTQGWLDGRGRMAR